MRCRHLVAEVLAASLYFPALGRLLSIRNSSASLAPHNVLLKQTSGCPATCACEGGGSSNNGVATPNGLCYDFCSAPHDSTRYCGRGQEYQQGDYIDCTACNEAKYFKGSYTLHEPSGHAATESIILLGPFNATSGWGSDWIMSSADGVDPAIRQRCRVLDVIGKPAKWGGMGQVTAWYGYADYEQWYAGVPVAPEVDHAVAYVHALIEQEYKVVGDYRRISVVGLHQGANLALEAAFRFHHPLGLVVSQRGVLIPARLASTEAVPATPYILTSGEKDIVYTDGQIRGDAASLQAKQGLVFMKMLPGFDHFQWSEQEATLVLKSISAALSEVPISHTTLAALTDWTVAS